MAHNMSSSDPFPVGGWSDPIDVVQIREAGYLTIAMRVACASGTVGDRPVEIDVGMDGSVWVSFPDEPHPYGGTGKGRQFVVKARDVVIAAAGWLDSPAGAVIDATETEVEWHGGADGMDGAG